MPLSDSAVVVDFVLCSGLCFDSGWRKRPSVDSLGSFWVRSHLRDLSPIAPGPSDGLVGRPFLSNW